MVSYPGHSLGGLTRLQRSSRYIPQPQHYPLGWGCRIHRLLLCRGVRTPPTTSVLYMTLNNLMMRFQQWWSFREWEVPLSLPSLPGPLCPGVVAPDKGPIYGLNRTNGILMLNWIIWFLSLFNGLSTIVGYLMPKLSFEKNSSGTIQPMAWRIRGFTPFQGFLTESERTNSLTTISQFIALTITPRGHPWIIWLNWIAWNKNLFDN